VTIGIGLAKPNYDSREAAFSIFYSVFFNLFILVSRINLEEAGPVTRRPASADRTARRQFQVVFPVITGSFPTNIIADLYGLSMDLTVGRTVGPIVDSTVG